MALSKKSFLKISAGPDNPRGYWPYAAPTKPATSEVKTTAEFDIVHCPICEKLVTIPKNAPGGIDFHYQTRHPKEWEKAMYGGSDEESYYTEEDELDENFEPAGGGERSGKLCPKCKERGKKHELSFYDEYNPGQGLYPYYQCESCGYWQDAPEEVEEEFGADIKHEDLYKDCPQCGSEMEEFEAETNTYWVCDKCGNVEKKEDDKKPKWKSVLQKPIDWFSDVFGKYETRTKVEANQISPNIWLGDVANGWFMRDKGTGKPFDAILNVSQHSYTPPPDVEYVHIPIEEHALGKKHDSSRQRDLIKAASILDKWTDEGKQIYLHCSEGMNRSPSVLALHLFKGAEKDWIAEQGPLSESDREALYDVVLEDIQKKRFVASPYGHMEDALREVLGLPKYEPKTKTFEPKTKGGWWAPEKMAAPKYPVGNQVQWVNPSNNKIETGTVISAPRVAPDQGLYWIKDQGTGQVVTLREKDIVTKQKKQPARYYPGEKGVMQTHPKFPPSGGVIKKKKKKKALSKRGFTKVGVMRRGGTNIIARFIRRAINMDELYNFYAVMQLPPQFFKAFPKWDAYAKNIVSTVAKEYAKYLEQLCRTEAEETHSIKGGDDGDEYHEHDWTPYDEDEHQCSDCGDTESHDEWSDADETGHTCGNCSQAESHEFDYDHECGKCGGSYPHNWVISGDQEFRCETNDEGQGCGAQTEKIDADDEAPYYGDFWEEQHKHNFQEFPADESYGEGVRCNLCGRAFIDETGKSQKKLPGVQQERVNFNPNWEYTQNIQEKKDKLRAEHEENPKLHRFRFIKTDNYAKYDETEGYIPGNIYRCPCGEEMTLYGEDEPQTGKVEDKQPAAQTPDWQKVVVGGNCPECSKFGEKLRLNDTGNGFQCPRCGKRWDYQGNAYVKGTIGRPVPARALSFRQLIAAEPALKWPRRKRRRPEPTEGPMYAPKPQQPQQQGEMFPQQEVVEEQFQAPQWDKQEKPLMPYREIPQVDIDTSKWFDFYVNDPAAGKLIPWSEMRKTYKPSYWRLFEKSIIDNPESVLTMIGPGTSGELEESVDQKQLAKFKNLVNLKKNLLSMKTSDYEEALARFEDYRNTIRTDADDIFMAATGLKSLYEIQSPDDKDALTLNQIKPELASAWKKYLTALEKFDPDIAAYYRENQAEAPKPEWEGQAAAASDQKVIAKGTGSSPGVASGRCAITAEMALQFAGEGPVILVRPETTPEDIAAMKVSAGFLTAHGGPTAHAAIVARQMGKPCVTGAAFAIQGDVILFGNTPVEVGTKITIDGRNGSVMISEKADAATPEAVEEKHVEPPQEGENWDDEFEKILALDQYMKKSKGQSYDYDDLKSMDLIDLAQAFNTDLGDGAYGGTRWGLASIRAKQLQEALELGMPWKYLGMLVDQINTLQHNSGNIFAHKPWPGKPGNWINEVLDTKGSEHAMQWMETQENLEGAIGRPGEKAFMFTDETRKMLRDYRLWARRAGYPSIYGTDVSQLSEKDLAELKNREMKEVRKRREKEMGKWSNSRVIITKRGNTVTAFHKIAGARMLVYVGKGRQEIYSTKIADHWKGKGILREMAEAVAKAL